MRAIKLEELQLPADWAKKAADALDDVQKANAADRSTTINNHQAVWSSLKEALKKLSHDKCWYCESRNPRADNAVDHYRPKGRVHEAPKHDGYWWLAFEWSNYRFSCTYCNSKRTDVEGTKGGKGDHFPIKDEKARAFAQGKEKQELPMLLDPTVDLDVGLLWFDENGAVTPRYEKTVDETLYERALVSIDRYHLPHLELVERRAVVCRAIRALVEGAHDQIKTHGAGSVLAHDVLNKTVKNLKAFLEPNAEYSAAARCMLKGMRTRFVFADLALS